MDRQKMLVENDELEVEDLYTSEEIEKMCLEHETRRLIAYSVDMFGQKGLEYLEKLVGAFAGNIRSGKTKISDEWLMREELEILITKS